MTEAERRTQESRRAQGLPPHIDDPETLRRLAEIIATPQQLGIPA